MYDCVQCVTVFAGGGKKFSVDEAGARKACASYGTGWKVDDNWKGLGFILCLKGSVGSGANCNACRKDFRVLVWKNNAQAQNCSKCQTKAGYRYGGHCHSCGPAGK